MKKQFILVIAASMLSIIPLEAQFNRELMEKTIAGLSDSIYNYYIIEDKARELSDVLDKELINGNLQNAATAEEFTQAVNQLMYTIAKDYHLNLYYSEKTRANDSGEPGNEPDREKETREFLEANQYGIPNARILPGNIGYLETSLFGPLDYCAEVIARAMKKIVDTDGLIIDLRNNRGSIYPNTIPFFSGYFFDKPVHLINFENRSANTVRQMWSAAWVPGKKYLDKPVYILTSNKTFSGAEEFAFDFKMLKRAIIIGEKTKGGANPIITVRLNDHFHVSMPYEKAVNPVTGTNWEQIGVAPDIEIDASKALQFTNLTLLRNILATSADSIKNKTIRKAIDDIDTSNQKTAPLKSALKG
ncbi:S41 family peptidase [Flavobacteriaceae bacterium KMM 6897]|nr:S41 family peptidase [Flavobacteriaceae bacterium KMM 6897]